MKRAKYKTGKYMQWVIALLLLSFSLGPTAHTPPDHARVFFVDIKDGDVVKSPLHVKFGIEGFGIVPAGFKGKERHKGGHFHLLLDAPELPDMDAPIPNSDHYIHYDRGEMEAVLELTPGQHVLQLLLGDEEHEPHAPPLISEQITITVK